MSNLFKDSYARTKEYKDKKTSNVLKQAATFIKNNNQPLFMNLVKRQGIMPGTPKKNSSI